MHATYTQTGAEMLGSSGAGPPTAPLLRWDCLGAVRARTSSRRKCAHACPRMVGMIGHQPLRQTRSHRSSRTHARRQDKAVHACGSGQALSFSTRDASAAANLLSGVPSAPKLPALRTASTSACFVALWPRRLARSNASSPCASVGLVASLGHALGTSKGPGSTAPRLWHPIIRCCACFSPSSPACLAVCASNRWTRGRRNGTYMQQWGRKGAWVIPSTRASAPARKRASTQASCPLSAAQCKACRRPHPQRDTWAPRRSSSRTTAARPRNAACISGVHPA